MIKNKFQRSIIHLPKTQYFMKTILSISILLFLCWQASFAQRTTPWNTFPDDSDFPEDSFFKIFDGVGRINGEYLEIGDFIGAFNEEGRLAGVTEITELVANEFPIFSLQIFGDAASTNHVEGPAVGENYSIQFYDASNELYYELDHFGPWTSTNQNGDQADGDDQSEWNAMLLIDGPMKIDLLALTGRRVDDVVVLEWSTISEEGNDFFTIEKSSDSRHFEAIGRVDGAGNSNEKRNYYFIDKQAVNGINYYRLKSTAQDGRVEYSSVVSVLMPQKDPTTISFYPNPVSTHLNVEVSANYDKNNLRLELFDMTGRLALSQTLDMTDSFSHSVSVQDLAKGAYLVKVVGQTYVQTQKITIK